MAKRWTVALLVACAGLGACGKDRALIEEKGALLDWKDIATPDDRGRLRQWRQGWLDATAQVQKAGKQGELDSRAPLFAFDQAQLDPLPPPGDYRCRLFKLGSRSRYVAAFTTYPVQKCRIERAGDTLAFTELDGDQRTIGSIYKAETARGIFLGTLMLKDESQTIRYGRDTKRDLAGDVERIADRKWRIALPYPHFESMLDVIELEPA